jgi:hypothetical protein
MDCSGARDFCSTGDEVIETYFAQLRDWVTKPKYSDGGFTRAAVELADLRGTGVWIPSRFARGCHVG